jgi:general secretion pathway protein D
MVRQGIFAMAGVMGGRRLRPLLALSACLACGVGIAGAAQPVPGQYVDSNGNPIVVAPQRIVGPNGQVIAPEKPALVIRPGEAPPPSLPNVPPPPRGARSVSTNVSGDGITMNFVDVDVRDVARAVLGDYLGLNYAVGANVQGTITIQTSRPVPKADVLPVLEQSLQLNGLAMVKNGTIYNIVPLTDARRQNGVISKHAQSEPGFGVQIVPLKYISATEMQHLLEPLAPSQAIVYGDAARNFLIIEGSEAERAALVDEIALFDVDWLQGMSFVLLTPKYTDAMSLSKELDDLIGGEHSAVNGAVRLVPIQRLNAVLAISQQPRYLAKLQQWMERLDLPGQGADKRLFFYPVQNGRAADLAEVVYHSLYGGKIQPSGFQVDGDSFTQQMQIGGSATTQLPQPQTSSQTPAQSAKDDSAALPDNAQGGGNPTITVDKINNALVVYGTPQQFSIIEALLHKMDVPPIQVQLDVAIAEVTLTQGLEYGVQYFYQPGNQHQLVLSNSNSSAIAAPYPGFSYMFTEGANIKVILNALSTVTHVEVLSSPQVMVLNNGTAQLEVGNQVPIATATAVGVETANAPIVNSIEYHATGVILKVSPGVNKSGMVTMDISQEVSDVADNEDNQTSPLGTPTFAERKIQSTVAIHDNETVALGGLISDNKTKGSSGIPFLSEIPVLGGLFGTKHDTHDRTELMVLITPHVIADMQTAHAVTEELRRKFPAVQTMLEKPK